MLYPFWDVPFGYGILMAVIAVVHVFISHFAIGGGLYLVVSEQRARKYNDSQTLEFLVRLSRFFALVTLVSGALTGVAIWFIIGLLNPTATEALIHNYVWGWAIEWTFFVVEFTAAIVYYYGWKRMAPDAHVTVGWIYFVFAWLSLAIINGIVTFMLTPGRWLETGYFWDGFFNPTYWPSLVLRTGICIMLAGLYGLLVVSRQVPSDWKRRTVRQLACWGVVGLIVSVLSQFWYWKAVPASITTTANLTMPATMHAWDNSMWLAGLLAVILVLCWFLAQRMRTTVAVVLMLVGLAWFGEFESWRESIRKPYVITGYIYANGTEVAKTDLYKKDGYTPHIAYSSGDTGADLFRHACRSCHTIGGYNPLKQAFDGTEPAFISSVVQSVHLMRGNMPPFLGTKEEADLIASHLYKSIDQRPLDVICKERGEDLGQRAYQVRCGKCHVVGGYGDKLKSFAGLTEDDIDGMLDMLPDMDPGMPAYTGNDTERAALIDYITALGKGTQP